MKVRILTHAPFVGGFGGLEHQAQGYVQILQSKYDAAFLKRDEQDIDVLHIVGHRLPLNRYFFHNLKAKGVKVVLSPVFYTRPFDWRDFRRPAIFRFLTKIPYTQFKMRKELRQSTDLILPNSQAEKDQLLQVFGKPNGRLEVLYNRIPQIDPNLADEEVLKKRNLQKHRYFVSISHIEPRKNTLNLIKAFLKFATKNPSYKLVLIGKMRWSFGNFFEEVQKLLNEHSDKIIHIDGLEHWNKEFVSLLRYSKAHLLPSFLETPWLSSLEASSLGVPILIGNDEPVREVFWAWWVSVSPYSVQSVAQGIQKISQSPYSQEMAKWIQSRYSKEVVGKRFLELYESLQG